MPVIAYLKSLIAGIEMNSSIPVQKSELEFLLLLIKQQTSLKD